MSNYSRGANFERRVQRYLEKHDWFVIRSAGSRSLIDLVAIKGREVQLLQCKTDGELSNAEALQLLDLLRETGCRVFLFSRDGKRMISEEIRGGK